MSFFSKKRKERDYLETLSEQKYAIEDQIRNIQDFITEAPEKLAQEQQNKRSTLPAPAELEDRLREQKFYARLSRGDISNQHRHQAKNGIFVLLLVLMAAGLFSWAWRIFTQ